jgi:hypothetical protein
MTAEEVSNLEDVIAVMREYLDKRQTGQLEVNRRLDFLVSKLGGIDEIAHRIDAHDAQIDDLHIIQQTTLATIQHAQQEFDTRTQMVLRDAEALRNSVLQATTTFQRAQDDQNADWDDKWDGLGRRLDAIEEAAKAARREDATVQVAKIGRDERVWIAVITIVCGGLVSLVASLVLNAGK